MEDRNSMKTNYINEYTHEVFDTEKEAMASEKKYLEAQEVKKRKDSERAERAKELEAAMQKVIEAKKAYRKLLNEFCKDYGAYHYSLKDSDDFFELVNNIFN